MARESLSTRLARYDRERAVAEARAVARQAAREEAEAKKATAPPRKAPSKRPVDTGPYQPWKKRARGRLWGWNQAGMLLGAPFEPREGAAAMTGRDVLKLIGPDTPVEDIKSLLAFGLGCCGVSAKDVPKVIGGTRKLTAQRANRGLKLSLELEPVNRWRPPEPEPEPDDVEDVPPPPED